MARSKMSSTPIVFLGVLSFTIFNIMRSMNYPNHIENILPATDITVQIKEKASPGLSPFFSVKPLTKSLHPNWKLFNEMSENQQDEAIDAVGVYLTKYAKVMGLGKNTKHGECVFDANIGRTGHTICGPPPPQPCTFFSFGINDDPSWDREVANVWKCRGFAADPTVHHPSKLHDNVTFHNIGATTLQDNEERINNKGGTSDWWTTSFPKLRYFLGVENIAVLKIDCEGCEMALSRDMLREDPSFLHHVDQISIETHVTKTWMTTREHVYYFGLLFVLLEEAGFKMEWSDVFGCSKRHEITGCMPELAKYGWPCGYDPWPNRPNVVLGRSCQEFTWKRYPINEE
mmetsp:Transcript_19960/g.23853  ORF Transcript_19960/g.23853 Transcript_19960/m.23853 type:complete len:344 (+) Transcript_19960:48-1079(+)